MLAALSLMVFVGCSSGPKPLYQRSLPQIDAYLHESQTQTPALTERIVTIARANVGQPYELYLLGEAPFETVDPQPVYNLQKSDCVVFLEHTLAMSLTDNLGDFLKMLQRIRYKDGAIGVVTRNHYTEADWNVNNRWLATDITRELGGDACATFKQVVDRKAFFKKRYKLTTEFEKQTISEDYIPYTAIESVKSKLKSGDIVNFVKGTSDTSCWVHHVGLVAVMPDGAVHLIHSTAPRVREEPIEAFIARNTKDLANLDAQKKPRHRGFKFLRPTADPIASLKEIDGAAAPRLTLPPLSQVTWDEFVATVLPKD